MDLREILDISIMLLLLSVFGYVMTVIKEKKNLRSKNIVIDRKGFQSEHMEGADMKVFKLGKWILKSGDEVKLVLRDRKKIKGIVLGAQKGKGNDKVILFTYDNKREVYLVKNIKKVTLISRYGSFFR